jgi:hypothetical protein
VLDDGVISPVELFMVNPAGALKVPPLKAPVPDNVTDAELTVVQKGVPVYEMVAVGTAVITTDAVVVTAAQPPAAGFVYVTVYVPAVLVDGVMAPVPLLIVNPAGAAVYVPPV